MLFSGTAHYSRPTYDGFPPHCFRTKTEPGAGCDSNRLRRPARGSPFAHGALWNQRRGSATEASIAPAVSSGRSVTAADPQQTQFIPSALPPSPSRPHAINPGPANADPGATADRSAEGTTKGVKRRPGVLIPRAARSPVSHGMWVDYFTPPCSQTTKLQSSPSRSCGEKSRRSSRSQLAEVRWSRRRALRCECHWTFWFEILDCVFSMASRNAETSAWTFDLRFSLPLNI